MKAVNVQSSPNQGPALSSAIKIQYDAPTPQLSSPGELLIGVKATTVIRDNLIWPELYANPPARLGNDFSGVVLSTYREEETFKPGDEVYGMTHANRGGTWAEYAIVTSDEAYHKPSNLSWEEAAAAPLSALTADQALFDHADLEFGTSQAKSILITGAAGAVGMFLVQLATAAGHHVVAATSSNERNKDFLHSIGAIESIEYDTIHLQPHFDVIVDTVGDAVLQNCWAIVKSNGSLISVDSSSWDFVNEHRLNGLSNGKENVHAEFFIVEPSKKSMARISELLSRGSIWSLVSKTMSLEAARAAYELCDERSIGRGKIVLLP